MSVQAQESRKLMNYSGEVISKQQINVRKNKLDGLIRFVAYIFYGILFGLLSSSFKFANSSQTESIETNSVIGIFGLSFLSLAVIYWTFKGEIRKYMPTNYYLVHLLNAIVLTVGIFVLSWFPVRDSLSVNNHTDELNNIQWRQFIIMCSTIGWSVFVSGLILVSFLRTKKIFPLSWAKIGYSSFVLIFGSLLSVFIYLAARSEYDGKSDASLLLQFVSLAIYFIAFLIFVLGITYIKVYRDVLLGERTEFEIQAINDWEDAKSLSLISSCSAVITFITIIFWDSAPMEFDLLVILNIVFDALLVVIYFVTILVTKINEVNSKSKVNKSKFINKFKSIDSTLLIEIIVWVILCKTIIVQGAIISKDEIALDPERNQQLFFVGMVSFIAIISLYIINSLFNVNIPNVKNAIISLCVILGSILLESTTLAFIAEYKAINHPAWLSLYMVLPIFLGTSVSLLVRIFTMIKIFDNKNSSRAKQINAEEIQLLNNNDNDELVDGHVEEKASDNSQANEELEESMLNV